MHLFPLVPLPQVLVEHPGWKLAEFHQVVARLMAGLLVFLGTIALIIWMTEFSDFSGSDRSSVRKGIRESFCLYAAAAISLVFGLYAFSVAVALLAIMIAYYVIRGAMIAFGKEPASGPL